MIKAIYQNGEISPLDPIPPEWADGRVLQLTEARDASAAVDKEPVPSQEALERIDAWYAELERLGPAEYDPGEREAINALLEQVDRESKEQVRKQMGLA